MQEGAAAVMFTHDRAEGQHICQALQGKHTQQWD